MVNNTTIKIKKIGNLVQLNDELSDTKGWRVYQDLNNIYIENKYTGVRIGGSLDSFEVNEETFSTKEDLFEALDIELFKSAEAPIVSVIPEPPTTGSFTLQSNDGVLSWVENVEVIE